MKWIRTSVLVTMICLPLFVLFTFDDVYNGLQDSICRQYPTFATACTPYAERYNRSGFVSTSFYRHLGSYLGRSQNNAPAFIESVRAQKTAEGIADPRIPRVEKKLTAFNRSFIAALNISLALAGAALAILIQKIIKRHHTMQAPRRSQKTKQQPKVIAPTVTKTLNKPRTKATTTPKRRPIKKTPVKKSKPRAIRPDTHL